MAVIAFNRGDGNDTVSAIGSMALSLGAGIAPADLTLSREGDDLILGLGGADSIRLTRSFEADPQAWPSIVLQMISGAVHTYDLNAVIADFEQALANDPSLTQLALDGVLQAHPLGVSATDALGGALAWRYATAGSVDAPSTAQNQAGLPGPPSCGSAPRH